MLPYSAALRFPAPETSKLILHRTGRERIGSVTLQTLQDPILGLLSRRTKPLTPRFRTSATWQGKGKGEGGKLKKPERTREQWGVRTAAPVKSVSWVHATGPGIGDFSSAERVGGKQLLRCGDTTVRGLPG
jgi:hypothetical protein